jgi:uncharacterized protein (TIGR03435 family)
VPPGLSALCIESYALAASSTKHIASERALAGRDSKEDDELTQIELTYSILDDINQTRPAFGRPAVCIIQVERLMVANGAIKMKNAEPPISGATFVGHGLTWENGTPHLPPGHPTSVWTGLPGGVIFIAGRMQTIGDLIRVIQGPVGRLVVDGTGLSGTYDYTLRFASEMTPVRYGGDPAAAPTSSPSDASMPMSSLKSALLEQLGLKLESARMAVEILSVDRFSKVPSEN